MARTNDWKQAGNISLWRYEEGTHNYPGWQITADAAGSSSFIALLEAMAADAKGGRTIMLMAPTQDQLRVPNNKGGSAAWLAPAKLRVSFAPAQNEWVFPPDLDPAVLSIGSAWVQPLMNGLEGLRDGRGDYSIGSDEKGSLKLWFWWRRGGAG